MTSEIRVAPQNSVVLIMDRSIGKIPAAMDGQPVAATTSCIAVGTRSEFDGDTLISFVDEECGESEGMLVFDGILETPTHQLAICNVLDQPLLVRDVPEGKSRVRVWVNDDMEPDAIRVCVGGRPS